MALRGGPSRAGEPESIAHGLCHPNADGDTHGDPVTIGIRHAIAVTIAVTDLNRVRVRIRVAVRIRVPHAGAYGLIGHSGGCLLGRPRLGPAAGLSPALRE